MCLCYFSLLILSIRTHLIHSNIQIEIRQNRWLWNTCSKSFFYFLFLLWCIWPMQHSVCDSIFPFRLFSLRISYRLIPSSYYKVVVFIDPLQGLYVVLLEILLIVYHFIWHLFMLCYLNFHLLTWLHLHILKYLNNALTICREFSFIIQPSKFHYIWV